MVHREPEHTYITEWECRLKHLHEALEKQYELYCTQTIDETTYLKAIKSIDRAIGEVEMMAMFHYMFPQRVSSSEHTQKQENCQSSHDTS